MGSQGKKEGGFQPASLSSAHWCICRHGSQTTPWAERRRPPGPSVGGRQGGSPELRTGLGTAGPRGALSTAAAPGLLVGPGTEPTRPRSGRCLHSSRACPLHPGSRARPRHSAGGSQGPQGLQAAAGVGARFESGEGDGADPAGCPGARWRLALLWEEGRSSVSPALEPREGHWPGEAGGAGD